MPVEMMPDGILKDVIRAPFYDGPLFKEDKMRIEQVKNGFIVSVDNEQYVFSSLYRVQKFITQYYTKKKK